MNVVNNLQVEPYNRLSPLASLSKANDKHCYRWAYWPFTQMKKTAVELICDWLIGHHTQYWSDQPNDSYYII